MSMIREDNEAMPSFLENESRGDRSNFKGTLYHLVYTIWLLLHEYVSSVSFYRGNDLLVQPPREVTDKVLVPIHAQQGTEDIWIQLKSTAESWTVGKLLKDNLLDNFLYNALLSERRGKAWQVRLITQGAVSRPGVEKFVDEIEASLKKGEIPPISKGSNHKLLHDVIIRVQQGWLEEGYSTIDELHLYSIALNILRELGRTESVSQRVLETEIKQQIAPIAPTHRAIQQLPSTLLGILLQATSPGSTTSAFTLEWLEQRVGIPLKAGSLLDSDPVAACFKASQSALPRDWEAGQCVPRPRLQNALRQFQTANQPLFVLLGTNKSGMTWTMADWATHESKGCTRLLVKGEDFQRHRELATLVATHLREPTTTHLNDEQILRKVLTGGNGQEPVFLLIIDGLVLRGDIDDIRYDLEKLVEDCRRRPIKLILTCQKHAWDLKNPGLHIHSGDIFRLESEMVDLPAIAEDLASPPHSFLLEDLTYDELSELLVRRLPSGRVERAVSQFSAPAFTPLRNPYLLDLYLKQHSTSLGTTHGVPVPVNVDSLLDTRIDHFLHEVADRLECGVGTIRSAFDALIEQLWEKRSDGLTYKQAIACLNTCLPEQESSSMLHQLQRMGLFTHEHPVCFTEQERPIAERLFAKWLGKQQQDEDDLAGTLQPETDTGVITAFLRGVATDPVAWAERLVAQEDRWLSAVTAGLAQGSPDDYRSLALLTTLARPKSRAIVGFEACTALGQLASRGERAWKWVAQMYFGGREEERYRGEAALATAMGTAPYRVGAAIRLRLSRVEKLDRGQRERVLKDTLTPLLGINHRVAADVGRRILQRYSYLAENDWQVPTSHFWRR